MADELSDRLDGVIDAIVARGDATAGLRDPELAAFVRIAADLRHYPGADFKARLRAQLANFPLGSSTGRPAPNAAAMGSSMT